MDIPKGFKPKDVKDLKELLEGIKNRGPNEIYTQRVQCPYFQLKGVPGDVFLKIKGEKVIGIKCDYYKRTHSECYSGNCSGTCYLKSDWQD